MKAHESGASRPLDVCMFVYNTFVYDARVHKQAASLADAGHSVTVVALSDGVLPDVEERSGYTVLRVPRSPWHIRIIRGARTMQPLAALLRPFARVLNWLGRIFSRLIAALPGIRLSRTTAAGQLRQSAHSISDLSNGQKLVGALFAPLVLILLLHPGFRMRVAALRASAGGEISGVQLWVLSGFRSIGYLRSGVRLAVARVRRLFRRLVIRPLKLLRKLVARLFRKVIVLPFASFSRWLKAQAHAMLKSALMPFHRQFCFLDYYTRSFRLLRDKTFDVYQGHDLNTMPIAWCLARRNNKPLVYDSHEYYLERNIQNRYTRFGKWLRSRLERKFVRAAAANITVNDSIAKALGKQYGVNSFHVIMNTPSKVRSVLDQQISLRERLAIPAGSPICLYLGAITFNRGLKQTISSLRLLPRYHLVLMGPGQPVFLQELRDWAIGEGVDDRMHIFGPVPSDEVTAYAASADIGVAPIENACLSYYYCSPNKVFEYILSGLPIVASDFPELRKIVSDFDVGLLFDPESPESIANAIRRVSEEPGFRENVLRNMDRAADAFNWENESRKLLTIFREVA